MGRLILPVLVFCAIQGLAQQSQSPPPAAQDLVRARGLVAAHQLQQANEILSSLVQNDPENLPALLELGKVQAMQRLNDDALKSFEAVLAKQPGRAIAS